MKYRFPRKIVFSVFIINLLIGNLFAQNSKISSEEQIGEDVQLAPCNSAERLEGVKKLFIKMGASVSDISTEKFKEGENLVIKKKGETSETIVIGAHYDKIDAGCGAIDNWTGIVIMANIYKTLASLKTKKSYLFVAFDKEEAGLLGSKAMVKAIPKESLSQYCSMINMDSFGFAAPQAPVNMANSKMEKLAREIAKQMKIQFADAPIEDADADSSSFLSRKIPAITFDGLSNDWQKFLHTKNDQRENINIASVYLGYRFVLAFALKADESDCAAFR
jgi:Zn-dependent M28 family amino/carboxypeptidase